MDAFAAENLAVFGPDRNAAALEGSKIFAKTAMHDCGIPTAQFGSFSDAAAARAFIAKADFPIVVKADGLAAGKGVIVTSSKDEAIQAVEDVMERRTLAH